MSAYYNEFDPVAAAWLRELIKAGHIANGEVDTRSIEDVSPRDLDGFTQCHFFAGIGGWSRALRLAGWDDARPVWTGSCPCQPFSAAGKGGGMADERHLWPALFHLIEQCRPAVCFGEQVASKDGLQWLDLVHADLERARYAFGAADLCAAGVGAPHIRQRLYWVADSNNTRLEGRPAGALGDEREAAQRGGGAGRLADANERTGQQGGADVRGRADRGDAQTRAGSGGECLPGGMADHLMQQRPDGQPGISHVDDAAGWLEGATAAAGLRDDLRTSPTAGFWRDADWLGCRDAKWRPVEPGTFPLAHGLPRGVVPSSRIGMEIDANKTAEARVMRLRGYGNAIVPAVAATFISAAME